MAELCCGNQPKGEAGKVGPLTTLEEPLVAGHAVSAWHVNTIPHHLYAVSRQAAAFFLPVK